jgi:uncharacterized membrane protein
VNESTRPALASFVRERAWELVVWGVMAVWTVVLYVVVRDSFLGFRIGRFDLGNMVQAVWSTTQGRLLETTDGATGEQISRLGVHVDPLLALLAPLWAVWPSPLALALAQIAVVSTGALPVYWLGRRHLGSERAAGLLALGYLTYPWVVTSAASAIHPVTFAIPLLLFGIWFLDTDRLLPFLLTAAVVMSTGELMGLPIAGLGVWYALARGRRVAGAAITAVGMLWTVAAVYVVVPAARGDTSRYYGFYDEIGGSPQGVAKTLLTDPGAVLGALFEVPDLAYILWLSVPLCGLFLLSPGLAALALPQLVANGLSDFASMTDPRYHSVAAVIPFLIAATVFGVARLAASRQVLAAASVVVTSTLVALAVGPWPRLVGVVPLGGRAPLEASHVEALREAISRVPPGAPTSASNVAGAHLSARQAIYTVPVLGDATWALLDLEDPWATSPESPLLQNRPAQVRRLARRLDEDRRWRKVFERDGVLVFRKLPG